MINLRGGKKKWKDIFERGVDWMLWFENIQQDSLK